MTKAVVVTTRIDEVLADKLDALALDLDRSRGWLIAQAIDRYVAEEIALLDAIREGEADIAAGRTISQEAVERLFGVDRGKRSAA